VIRDKIIPDPDPDPGGKKASDPGSGSATLAVANKLATLCARVDAAIHQRVGADPQQAAAHGGGGDLRTEQQEAGRQVHQSTSKTIDIP
jgi:hypothetical protein